MSIRLSKVDGPVPRGALTVVAGDGWGEQRPQLQVLRLPDSPPSTPAARSSFPDEAGVALEVAEHQPYLATVATPDRPFGVYAIYPSGGAPAHGLLLNRARLDWLSHQRAAPGAEVRAFGRGLVGLDHYAARDAEDRPVSFGADVSAHNTTVAVVAADGEVVRAKVLRASSYDVAFEVPQQLASGRAQIFLHNGHGGDHGWSEPATLEIVQAEAWPRESFSVLDYGAVGDGVHDDGPAIQAALDACRDNGGGVVWFPPGGYHFNQTLWVPPRTVLRGQSRERCWLYMPDGFGPNARDASVLIGIAGEGALGLEDLSIHAVYCELIVAAALSRDEPLPAGRDEFTWRRDCEDDPYPRADGSFIRRCRLLHNFTHIYHRRRNDAEFEGVSLAAYSEKKHPPASAFALRGDDLEITDCEILGKGSAGTIAASSHSRVARNRFIAGAGGNGFNMLVSPHVCTNVVFEDNVLGALSQTHHGALWLMHGSQNLHVARNKIENQFWVSDCEGLLCHIWGFGLPLYVKQAGLDWIDVDVQRMLAFKGDQKEAWRIQRDDGELELGRLVGEEVQVQDGPGLGLHGVVKAVEGNRVYFDRSWEVALTPDSVPIAFPHPAYRNGVFVDNVIEDTGPAIMIWGNGHDCVIDGNRCTRTALLGCFAVFYAAHAGGGCHFIQIINNTMDEGRIRNHDQHDPGGRYAGGYITTFYSVMGEFKQGDGLAFAGHVVRNNLLLNDSTIRFGHQERAEQADNSPRTDGGDKFKLAARSGRSEYDHHGVVIERNTIRDSRYGIVVGPTARAVLRDNQFDNVDEPVTLSES